MLRPLGAGKMGGAGEAEGGLGRLNSDRLPDGPSPETLQWRVLPGFLPGGQSLRTPEREETKEAAFSI